MGISERYAAFGAELAGGLARGIEEGSRRAALGLPPEPVSPESLAYAEGVARRSFFALYEDDEAGEEP
jgi:hypothetical protein